MQTNNAMKQKNNKTILLALILVLLMVFTFLGMLSHNPSTAFANGAVEDKAYRYNISKENNLFVLKGFRENLQEYVLTNSWDYI